MRRYISKSSGFARARAFGCGRVRVAMARGKIASWEARGTRRPRPGAATGGERPRRTRYSPTRAALPLAGVDPVDDAARKRILQQFPYGLFAVTVGYGGEEHG